MNFKKFIIEFLAKIDIFEYPISSLFNFKGKTRYSTGASKFMTIFVISLSIASFFYFQNNMKNNPMTGYKEDYIIEADEVLMNSENFFFSFAMENSSNSYLDYIDSTVYVVEARLQIWDYELNETTYSFPKLEIEPCNEKHIPQRSDLKKDFLAKNFTKMYCIKDYSKAKMKGTWASGSIISIEALFRPCNNKTENNTCKSPEFISRAIEGSFISVYYTSLSPKLQDYDDPLKYNFIYDFFQTSLDLPRDVSIYFGFEKVETISGFLFQETSRVHGVTYLKSQNSNFINRFDNVYLSLSVTLDPLIKVYTRKYDNIIDVLSKMGGIIKILTIFATFILKPFLNSVVMQRISNETFDYAEVKAMNHNGKNPITKITLSLWEYIKSKLMFNEKLPSHTKIMMKSIEKIKENLDISFFINKMFDVEKIKVILNKEMQFLEDEKPKIILDKSVLSSTVFKHELVSNFQKKFLILTDQTKNLEKINEIKENAMTNSKERCSILEIPERKSMAVENNIIENEKIFQDKSHWNIAEEIIQEKQINSIKPQKK